MRNELWSLMAYTSAPFWYFTISPADIKHPICLYYADTKQTFNPFLYVPDDRFRLIANNPVTGARFFHFMIQMFIKHIWGINSGHKGLYGKTLWHSRAARKTKLTPSHAALD